MIDYLEASAAKQLCGQVDIGVACFYCDYRDQKDQNPTSVIGSVLAQFISELVDIPSDIISSFDTAEQKDISLELKEAIAMLAIVLQRFQRGFICIDALDELEPAAQRTILQSLKELMLRTDSNIFLYLTGRPIVKPEVNQQLCKSPQSLASTGVEIEITASMDDIKHLLLHYIREKDRHPSAMNEVLKKKILDTITEKSDGMYVAKRRSHLVHWP